MLTRRIAASACALCLAVPAAATAKDVRYVGHSHHAVQAVAIVATGDTKNDIVVPAGKSAGAIASLTDKQLSAAYGGRLHAAHVTAAGSTDDGPDGWQIAAVAEAGLLAAFALGAATFVGRMRPRRNATA